MGHTWFLNLSTIVIHIQVMSSAGTPTELQQQKLLLRGTDALGRLDGKGLVRLQRVTMMWPYVANMARYTLAKHKGSMGIYSFRCVSGCTTWDTQQP